MIKCHLYWIVRSESETKLPQIGSNFTRSWLPWLPCEVKGASAGWWALKCIEYIKSLYAKLPKKKLTDAPFQGFVMKLKHQPAKYRKGKKSLVCLECWHGVFVCGWGTKTFGTHFWSASAPCPLIKTGDKLDSENWVIFIHKSKQDAVPAEYYGTYNDHLNFLAMRDPRLRPEMAWYCCMCLPLPYQDRDWYNSGENPLQIFGALNFFSSHFIPFCVIWIRTNDSCHCVRSHQSTYIESKPLTFLSNLLPYWVTETSFG